MDKPLESRKIAWRKATSLISVHSATTNYKLTNCHKLLNKLNYYSTCEPETPGGVPRVQRRFWSTEHNPSRQTVAKKSQAWLLQAQAHHKRILPFGFGAAHPWCTLLWPALRGGATPFHVAPARKMPHTATSYFEINKSLPKPLRIRRWGEWGAGVKMPSGSSVLASQRSRHCLLGPCGTTPMGTIVGKGLCCDFFFFALPFKWLDGMSLFFMYRLTDWCNSTEALAR